VGGSYRSPVERDTQGKRKPKKLTLGPVADAGEACDGEPKIGQVLTLADARALATTRPYQAVVPRGGSRGASVFRISATSCTRTLSSAVCVASSDLTRATSPAR